LGRDPNIQVQKSTLSPMVATSKFFSYKKNKRQTRRTIVHKAGILGKRTRDLEEPMEQVVFSDEKKSIQMGQMVHRTIVLICGNKKDIFQTPSGRRLINSLGWDR
jgi:hypothetical protein